MFGDSVTQRFKKVKNTKSGLVPMSRQEKLADLFLVFLARLETWPKDSYSFIKHSRNGAFRHFLVNLNKCTFRHFLVNFDNFNKLFNLFYHGNGDRHKNFDFSFDYVFPISMTIQSFSTVNWQKKKLSMIEIFNFFVSDHLKRDMSRAKVYFSNKLFTLVFWSLEDEIICLLM